jgi:hypothetical protein
MPFYWSGGRSIQDLAGDIQKYQRGAIGRVVITANRHAARAETFMREQAVWQNRTWQARRGLYAMAQYDAPRKVVQITMGYSVYYGVYLEEMQGGRFAIVGPTRAWMVPQLWAALEKVMRTTE